VICFLREAQALGLKHEGEFRKISLTVSLVNPMRSDSQRVCRQFLRSAGSPATSWLDSITTTSFVPADRADESQNDTFQIEMNKEPNQAPEPTPHAHGRHAPARQEARQP